MQIQDYTSKTNRQVKLQSLESVEDFDALKPGDVVLTGKVGPRLDGPMLVSNESKNSGSNGNGIILIQRYTPDSIYKVFLQKKDIKIEDKQLKFDFMKGKRINIFSDYDWSYYDGYMNELQKVQLE